MGCYMKLLMLGGSGILSTDFTVKCLDEGNEVFILNRGTRSGFIDKRAVLIKADLRNESVDELKAKIKDQHFDVIVDFLSFGPAHLEKNLRAFEGLFDQYVFISSATAYIKNDKDLISESRNEVGNKNWDYSYNKSLCEDYIKKSTVNYTIIRPYVTFGVSRIPFQLIPDGYHYTLISRIINDKPVALLDGGSAICTLTNTVDFANILYGLMLNPKAYRQEFHITSQSRQSWKEVYEKYCEILGHEPRLISVTLDDIKKYMPEYYQSLKGDKGTSWSFDNTKVLEAVGGYEFEYDLLSGLKRSIEYFNSHENMQGIDYKWEGKMDFMIKRVAGIKGLKPIYSLCDKSSKKSFYYLMTNPISHFAYMTLWHIKNHV